VETLDISKIPTAPSAVHSLLWKQVLPTRPVPPAYVSVAAIVDDECYVSIPEQSTRPKTLVRVEHPEWLPFYGLPMQYQKKTVSRFSRPKV
jgi:hypothetical protein